MRSNALLEYEPLWLAAGPIERMRVCACSCRPCKTDTFVSGTGIAAARGVRRTSRWLTALPLDEGAIKRRVLPTEPIFGAAYRADTWSARACSNGMRTSASMHRSAPTEDAVPRRHNAHCLGAAGFIARQTALLRNRGSTSRVSTRCLRQTANTACCEKLRVSASNRWRIYRGRQIFCPQCVVLCRSRSSSLESIGHPADQVCERLLCAWDCRSADTQRPADPNRGLPSTIFAESSRCKKLSFGERQLCGPHHFRQPRPNPALAAAPSQTVRVLYGRGAGN